VPGKVIEMDPKAFRERRECEGVDRLVRARAVSPPETAALKHQTDRFLDRALAPACDRCVIKEACGEFREGGTCILAERQQAQIEEQVMALPQVLPQDMPLVREFAKVATAIGIVDRYVAHASPFLPGAESGYIEPQPVMALRLRLTAQLRALASDLGLSPIARTRLASSRDVEKLLTLLRDLDKPEDAETVDAEFETEGDNDAGDREAGPDSPR
jgi:hypothetical protein